jgi:threonine dehydrogenase-like Zn-dependent dehydrogenase
VNDSSALVVLGVGQVGEAALRLAREAKPRRVLRATTRSRTRAAELAALGADAILLDGDDGADAVRAAIGPGDDVLVTFPPDGASDARLAAAGRHARRIVYVSTTGVYGAVSGHVDDDTPVDPSAPRAAPRLAAEEIWRAAGAIVLRAPAIYSAQSGLHKRLRAGTHRLVEDGSKYVSRIHADDLAALALAALERAAPGSTYVVGDHEPAPQREVVAWLCTRLGLPLPPSVAVGDAPPTLRGNRQVDARRVLRELGVTLRYPTYRDGYEAIVAGDAEG